MHPFIQIVNNFNKITISGLSFIFSYDPFGYFNYNFKTWMYVHFQDHQVT